MLSRDPIPVPRVRGTRMASRHQQNRGVADHGLMNAKTTEKSNMTTLIESNVVDGPFKVAATSRGTMRGEVSSQWFSRPDDQKFLNLSDLQAFTAHSMEHSNEQIVDVRKIQVQASTDNPDDLRLLTEEVGEVTPNHWSFGQLCSLTRAPAHYLRSLPGTIAGINLQHGILNYRAGLMKSYTTTNGQSELRSINGPDYGRIYDYEVVRAVRKIAGNGTGDTHWKVPGCMNWSDGTYDPNRPITKESTTLFASDRDIFLFLVDDRRPIEIGKLPDGSPDLVFRGFYVWNSEVGNRSIGVACFYLRGVCQNRCLWGVEGFQEISFRHSKYAPERFAAEVGPALNSFTTGSDRAVIEGVAAAKDAKVADDNDSAKKFLSGRGFNAKTTNAILETVLQEEGHEARSVWDMVQGITAVARTRGHQDARLDMERTAGALLDKVA